MLKTRRSARCALALSACALTSGAALAQADDGFDWVTIGAVGNADYDGPHQGTGLPPDLGGDRTFGGVDYAYRISRTQINTHQLLGFINTFGGNPDNHQWYEGFRQQRGWQGTFDPSFSLGLRFEVSNSIPGVDAGNLALHQGVSMRQALQYANWLHNGKTDDFSSVNSGVYDLDRFNTDSTFTIDRLLSERNPDARYWIPNEDEWVKAVYYDPNRLGESEGGYWQHSYASDEAPVGGYPDEPGAMTSAGAAAEIGGSIFEDDAYLIELGAYEEAGAISPWGLLDTSGGATELIAAISPGIGRPMSRGNSTSFGTGGLDSLGMWGSTIGIDDVFRTSFRVAATIPSPASAVVLALGVCGVSRRRR